MIEKFMPDAEPGERLRLMRDNADQIHKGEYSRQLSAEELAERREQYADKSIEVGRLEEELKEKSKVLKDQIKELKGESKELLQVIRKKFETNNGEIFYFADHESGMMSGYDETGARVEYRKLRPSEKQGTIMQMRAAQ